MDIPDRPITEQLLPTLRCKGGVPPCGMTTQPTRESDRLRGISGYFPLHQHRGCFGPVWDYERYLATRCVPFMTSFSQSYVLGSSQHAFQFFF